MQLLVQLVPLRRNLSFMSAPNAKQVVHFVPNDPNILSQPSVFLCSSGRPWNPNDWLPQFTMVVHDHTVLVSGTTHTCQNCKTTWSSS
jgi:hypothetical protein